MRISFTMPEPLFKFVQMLHEKRGLSISAAISHIVLTHPEFVAYEKDLARQAAETAKASVKTTVVVEARPTREQMLAEEQERRRQERWARENTPVDPPWPVPPRPAKRQEVRCEHGKLVTDTTGCEFFCFDCAVEAGIEVCHEHHSMVPCYECAMDVDDVDEAAP